MRIELRPETAEEIAEFAENGGGSATAFVRVGMAAMALVQITEKGIPKDVLYVHGNPMLAARKMSDLLAQLFMTNGPMPLPPRAVTPSDAHPDLKPVPVED